MYTKLLYLLATLEDLEQITNSRLAPRVIFSEVHCTPILPTLRYYEPNLTYSGTATCTARQAGRQERIHAV